MQSSTTDADSSKRRRTASSPNNDRTLSITNLPHDHLTAVALYLPRTSRGLLAVALTSSSNAFVDYEGAEGLQPNEASQAIISMPKNTGWDILHFADVGELATRLTDDDIHALLSVVDAKNNLKILRLDKCKDHTPSGRCCNNLLGHGLEPLRKSTVLQLIAIDSEMERLSTEAVSPIFDSIIDVDGNSLEGIMIYNVDHANDNPSFQKFMKRYIKLLRFEECPSCDGVQRKAGIDQEQIRVMNAKTVCFECFKFTCDLCNDYSDNSHIRKCTHCELTFCEDHSTRTMNFSSGEWEPDPSICDQCGIFHCHRCSKLAYVGSAHACSFYGEKVHDAICTDCVIKDHNRDRNPNTRQCCPMCLDRLIDFSFAKNKKQREVEDELREKNKQLHVEIEELREKMSSGLGILGKAQK